MTPSTGSSDRTPPLRIGIAGVGTVGASLLQLLDANRERLLASLGREIVTTGVSARTRGRKRSVVLDGIRWFDDPVKLAADASIDVFVELVGGAEGAARASVDAALKAGKHVVTANKALLARHGLSLARQAQSAGVALSFEAAVAGGIPVIKTLREALVANDVARVYGILNGTCNFILTKMQNEGLAFADALKQAQDLGYAEADPTFDIGGFDAAHKLALLTSLAFGTEPALDAIHIEGIESITLADIEAADDLGFRIKLLGVAERTADGIEQRVNPAMVPKHLAIADVAGPTNAVAIAGDFVGTLLLIGPGAGGNATASAVAADIADIARGTLVPAFIMPVERLQPFRRAALGAHTGAYYVRLSVIDRPGAMAAVAARMGEQEVSLESIVQRRPKGARPGIGARPEPGALTPVVLITHETTEARIRAALDAIERDGKVASRPNMIRIEKE